MKKLFILMLLTLVSVSAQYVDYVYNGPGSATASVGSVEPVAPVMACYDECKINCVQANSAEECAKLCTIKCNPPDPAIITIGKGEINPSNPPVRYNSCPVQCKLDVDVCLQKTQDREACMKYYNDCSQRCTVPVPAPMPAPVSCEQKCDYSFKECLAMRERPGIGAYPNCEMMQKECYAGCQPQPVCPPSDTCETRCADGYYKCAMYGGDCANEIVNCLGTCRPVPLPPQSCQSRCALIREECVKAGVDERSCGLKISECARSCEPRPVPMPLPVEVQPEVGVRDSSTAVAETPRGFWSRMRAFFTG